jgi:hypothetical protein
MLAICARFSEAAKQGPAKGTAVLDWLGGNGES